MKTLLLLIFCISLIVDSYGQQEAFRGRPIINEEIKTQTFLDAWNSIYAEYWDTTFSGLDWLEIKDLYENKLETVRNYKDLHSLLNDMVSELKVSHIGVIDNLINDHRNGSLNLSFRFIDKKVILVAFNNSTVTISNIIAVGDELIKVDSVPVKRIIRKFEAVEDSINLSRAIILNLPLSGTVGDLKSLTFLKADGKEITLNLKLSESKTLKNPYENKTLGDFFYSKLDIFDLSYHSELESRIQDIKKSKGWIIDLRGNPGGTESFNGSFASWLFPEDGFLGYEKSRNKISTMYFEFAGRGLESFSGAVVILIDEFSASTSEIFADALGVLERATIIGQRSSGKVFVARMHRLPSGAFLQIPVSQYINLEGETIEGTGVIPDIEVVLSQESIASNIDPTLDRAIEYLKMQN